MPKKIIYEEDAIDAAECIVEHHSITPYKTMAAAMDHLKRILNGMPSTQPEIIRCNVCRHWHQTTGEMKGFGLGNCDYLEKKLVTCNGYCYWAERKDNG